MDQLLNAFEGLGISSQSEIALIRDFQELVNKFGRETVSDFTFTPSFRKLRLTLDRRIVEYLLQCRICPEVRRNIFPN